MELKDLEYLIAIAEEKSISKAAERLYMAQSSLSQALTVAEHNLGYKLFTRTANGVRPTESGQRLIRFAYNTLSEFHRVRDEMQDISELKAGHVILGISSFRGAYLLPPVLYEFHKRYPSIHVEIVEKNSMALEQMLLTGEVDIALLSKPDKPSRIQVRNLMKDEICLITHPDHPIMQLAVPQKENQRKKKLPWFIDITKAAGFEFLLSGYDTILGREARRIFHRHNITPITYNENLTAMFAASLGASGLGIAFTYYSSRHYFQNAALLSLGEDGFPLQLVTATAPGRYHSKATLALDDVIFEVLGEQPAALSPFAGYPAGNR